ncbi:uncharacterized protein LOC110887971 [Helianthus annuus]|uniref:uncharacterized protein LOC110887971 n=1 Tax=Helianthus annuus TaxID=4232 RepID=UPI000B900321|nr:uncharacterized protein LOC110887971 [Helianthus annuus]
MFKINGVLPDTIKLCLFPFSLVGKARSWLLAQEGGSITTWEILVDKLLKKYFPTSKINKLRNKIITFHQQDGESFTEAWHRYKEIIRKCLYHGVESWQTQDTIAKGVIADLTPTTTLALMDKLVVNDYGPSKASSSGKKAVLYQVEDDSILQAKVEALTVEMAKLLEKKGSVAEKCTTCGGEHKLIVCPFEATEEASNVNYQGGLQNSPYSRTYTPAWWSHPNFSWRNSSTSAPPGFTQKEATGDSKPDLEDIMKKYTEVTNVRMSNANEEMKPQKVSLQNIEKELGRLIQRVTPRYFHILPVGPTGSILT